MARKPKYDQDRAKRIVDALRAGNTRRASAAYGGISEDTFSRWLANYADFAEQVALAEAECEVAMAAVIRKAATGYDVKKTRTTTSKGETTTVTEVTKEFDWRAAETWLKRRRREEWGDSLDIRKIPDDLLIRLLERDAATRSGASSPDDSTATPSGSG